MTAYGRHVRHEGCRFRTKSHEVGVAMWSSWVQPINTLPAAGTAKRARSYARATMMMPPTSPSIFHFVLVSLCYLLFYRI